MEVIVILVLIVVAFVWWVKRRDADWRTRRDLKIADAHYAKQAEKEGASQSDSGLGASSKALEIAAERYASGEISKEEFEEMKSSLQPSVEGKEKPKDPGLWLDA